ncbi:c-type cytochrome [Echinicola marina]|uniref:c-type cytochrome n=1 Tax=Echinicola marina TaxID=2859768 RepID=UPI001CF67819|nr:c-type cytochrome [Echinicola marina]UCS91755.1 c-type cytochrome [Echinicola marina]
MALVLFSCQSEKKENGMQVAEIEKKEFFVVPGEDEPIDSVLVQRGKVLISYADCYECHREESAGKGPTFFDIARRYPNNQVYFKLLGRKVVSGGSGTWGHPVMRAHPKLELEDAMAMVAYILSLEDK